jgi:hypothetical protein
MGQCDGLKHARTLQRQVEGICGFSPIFFSNFLRKYICMCSTNQHE